MDLSPDHQGSSPPPSNKDYLPPSEDEYKYTKLGPNEIRLLEIFPGHSDIHIKFHRCFLQQPVRSVQSPYCALSYAWGDTDERIPIYCDGAKILVTPNLHALLEELRRDPKGRNVYQETLPDEVNRKADFDSASPFLSRRLRLAPFARPSATKYWADAVCINQKDLLERKEQVGLMRDIYRECARAIFWLGRETVSSRQAIEAIREMDWIWENDLGTILNEHLQPDMVDRFLAALSTKRSSGQLTLEEHETLWHIQQLLNRPWFHRAWTLQETLLPTQADVRCGSDTIEWEYVCKAVLYLQNHVPGLLNDNVISTVDLWLDKSSRLATSSGRTGTLSRLMQIATKRKATDPRDKIFSLLGISSVSNRSLPIMADYGLSVQETFIRCTKAVIVDEENLNILASVYRRSPDPDLPSWVPDWRAPVLSTPLSMATLDNSDGLGVSRHHSITFRLPRDAPSTRSDPQEQQPGRSLRLVGVCIGVVRFLTPLKHLRSGNAGGRTQVKEDPICTRRRLAWLIQEFLSWCGLQKDDETAVGRILNVLSIGGLRSVRKQKHRKKYTFLLYFSFAQWRADPEDIPEEIDITGAGGPNPGQRTFLDVKLETMFAALVNSDDAFFDQWNWFAKKYKVLSSAYEKDPSPVQTKFTEELLEIFSVAVEGRSLFFSDRGSIGLAPEIALPGDLVYYLRGGDMPFILRRSQSGPDEFIILGDAYIEKLEMAKDPRKYENITLV